METGRFWVGTNPHILLQDSDSLVDHREIPSLLCASVLLSVKWRFGLYYPEDILSLLRWYDSSHYSLANGHTTTEMISYYAGCYNQDEKRQEIGTTHN